MEKKSKPKRTLRVLLYVTRQCWGINREYLALILPLVILGAASPYPLIIFPQKILDSLITTGEIRPALDYGLMMCGSILVIEILLALLRSRKQLAQFKLKAAFERKLSEKLTRLPYERLEDSEFTAKLERAKVAVSGDISWSVRSMTGDKGLDAVGTESVNILAAAFRLAGFVTILTMQSPLVLAVVLVIVIIDAIAGAKKKRADFAFRNATSTASAQSNYCFSAMNDSGNAKEIRLFAMRDFLVAKYRSVREDFFAARERLSGKYLGADYVSNTASCVQELLVYAYLIWRVFAGAITVGSFYLYAATVRSFSATLAELIHSVQNLGLFADYLDDYRAIMEEAEETDGGKTPVLGPVVFENVYFRYPGSDNWALEDLSLTLSPGEKLSIVGQNGAGKTTLVKLIMRFYAPTKGRVTMNGADIQAFDLTKYRKLITAVFQDFDIYSVTAGENIAFGRYDQGLMERTIEKCGLPPELKADSMMTKTFSREGFELSQGQKQKLALARAFYRDAPQAVMDEPTSALDPLAERKTYEDFSSWTNEKSAVYVSHRMSAARFSHRVLYFADGQLTEDGAHSELIAKGGAYAALYKAQAAYYQ